MKFLVFLFFFTSHAAFAADSSPEQFALPVMQNAVVTSAPLPASDSGCPPAGVELLKSVESGSGKAVSSSKIILNLVAQSAPARAKLESENFKCGVCKQKNLVSTYTTSAPQQLRTDQVCAAPFARNFQHELNNQDIEAYANDVLRGKNPEGAAMTKDCASSCNFSTASAQTPLTQTTSRLNLTVYCGPPRQGSIVFATYDFTVGFIHEYTCQK